MFSYDGVEHLNSIISARLTMHPKINLDLIVFPLSLRTLPRTRFGHRPASLTGKIYQESYNDSFYSEQVTDTIIFSDTQYFGYRLERLNGGLINTSSCTLSMVGLLIIIFHCSLLNGYPTSYTYDFFNSETSGSSSYTTSDGGSSTGTFTLNDALSVNVPGSLVGKNPDSRVF